MKRIAFRAVVIAGAMLLAGALAGAAAVPNVLVRPFTSTGNPGTYDWVGKGIQQSLLADLSGAQGVQITFAATQAVQNGQAEQEPGDSLALAARAGANLLGLGSYQINDNQLRITGEVYDVASAKNIGGIKATGPITDLFKLEDSLNDQLQRLLPITRAPALVAQPQVAPAQPNDSSSNLPTTVVVPAPQTSQYVYVYPSDSTASYYSPSYSSYPYYSGYYPYYSAPYYGYVGFSPIYRYGCYYPRAYVGGGFRVGFGGGLHGGFGGGFHGGGGRR